MRLILLFLMLCMAAPLAAGEVKEIRIAAHDAYTRAVIELDAAAPYRLVDRNDAERTVSIEISGVSKAPPYATVGREATFIYQTRVTQGPPVRIVLNTNRALNVAHYTLSNPPRIVVDLYNKATAPVFPTDAKTPTRTPTPTVTPSLPAPAPREEAPAPARSASGWRQRIIVDPGHGGRHKGGVGQVGGRTVYEKEITLQVAFRLERLLKSDSRFEVLLTRRDDRYIGLGERTEKASAMKGDLFVSLHTNAVPVKSMGSRARGLELWVWNRDGNRTAAANALEHLENDDPFLTRENNRILSQMMLDALESQSLVSRRLARSLEQVFLKHPYHKEHYRGQNAARFKVLEVYDMPSILIELGFITHPAEVKMMCDPAYQETLAKQIYDGIVLYYAQNDPAFPRRK